MAGRERLICAAAAVPAEGEPLRIELPGDGGSAMLLRRGGRLIAWRNSCPHGWLELDWNPGRFLDSSGLYLLCAVHGAFFEPESGFCVAGPCAGRSLQALPVVERDGQVFLMDEREAS